MMGPYIDIPGPEISAGSRMMSWFFDEYSKYKRFSPASVTGKVCKPPIPFIRILLWLPGSLLLVPSVEPAILFLFVVAVHLLHSCGLSSSSSWVFFLFLCGLQTSVPKQCASDLQPVDLHGSHGREYATGRGAVLATRELLLHAHAGKIANKDFVIQVRFLPANHFTASGPVVQQQECVGCHITTACQLLRHSCKNKRFLLIIAKASE